MGEPMRCCQCGDETSLVRDEYYGWICCECLDEMRRIERETDWDDYEQRRRERLAEENEY